MPQPTLCWLHQTAALKAGRALSGHAHPFLPTVIPEEPKTDKNIISDLPEKVESNRYCNLSTKQASLYQSTVDTIMEDLQSSEEGIERKGIIFKLLNALKQICNTPAQFLNHEQSEPSESGKLATFLEIIREATES
ncbi:SNF2-related protein, partial [Sansalvadorimonas sp. 2012CJ34-2]